MVATGLGNPVRGVAKPPIIRIVEPIQTQMTGTDGPTGFGGYDANSNYDTPTAIRSRRNQAAVEMAQSAGIDSLDIPAFLRKQAD
jgi:cell division protein FtsZ